MPKLPRLPLAEPDPDEPAHERRLTPAARRKIDDERWEELLYYRVRDRAMKSAFFIALAFISLFTGTIGFATKAWIDGQKIRIESRADTLLMHARTALDDARDAQAATEKSQVIAAAASDTLRGLRSALAVLTTGMIQSVESTRGLADEAARKAQHETFGATTERQEIVKAYRALLSADSTRKKEYEDNLARMSSLVLDATSRVDSIGEAAANRWTLGIAQGSAQVVPGAGFAIYAGDIRGEAEVENMRIHKTASADSPGRRILRELGTVRVPARDQFSFGDFLYDIQITDIINVGSHDMVSVLVSRRPLAPAPATRAINTAFERTPE